MFRGNAIDCRLGRFFCGRRCACVGGGHAVPHPPETCGRPIAGFRRHSAVGVPGGTDRRRVCEGRCAGTAESGSAYVPSRLRKQILLLGKGGHLLQNRHARSSPCFCRKFGRGNQRLLVVDTTQNIQKRVAKNFCPGHHEESDSHSEKCRKRYTPWRIRNRYPRSACLAFRRDC